MNPRGYPLTWRHLARRCKVLANWRCQQCGIRQGEQYTARSGKLCTVYLHAAHLDHDKANPNPRLRCLCPTCHGLYDWAYREREARVRLERLKHRRRIEAYLCSHPTSTRDTIKTRREEPTHEATRLYG